jgi:hypothetical protein
VRKYLVAVVAVGVGLTVWPMIPSAASADGSDLATKGAFSIPFREDRAVYAAQTADTPGGTLTGPERGDTGCKAGPEADGHLDCLPAGATQNVLADGRILYWNAIEGGEDVKNGVVPEFGAVARNDRSRVLSLDYADPFNSSWHVPLNADGYFDNAPKEQPLPLKQESGVPNDGSLFCSDQVQLANGTILTAGGTDYYQDPGVPGTGYGVAELEGIRNSRIFDPAADDGQGAWRPSGAMSYGRWYPSLVTLPNGNVFVASGVTKLIKPVYPDHPGDSGTNVKQTETYNPATEAWTYNGPTADRSLPLFPRLHLLPDGHVYYGAAGQSFNPDGQSYDEALWHIAASYDPAAGSWADLGLPGLGTMTEPGFRGSTFQQMLPLAPNADGSYSSASFLTAGGVTAIPSPGSYVPTATSRIDTVTIGSDGKENLTSAATGSLGRARWYSAGVTLPTGQVLAFSGADRDEVVSPGQEHPIRQAEMFTPDGSGGGTWSDIAMQNRRRTYHNNAVLLPTGQVLVGGHAPIPNSYGKAMNNPNVPGAPFDASNNFRDASFEIYNPTYLFTGVSRPEIDDQDPSVPYGQSMTVTVRSPDDAAAIEKVVLVRNPAETHLVDGDQRVVELPIVSRSGTQLHVDVTDNQAVLPAGPYMLFVIKGGAGADGQHVQVPSVAKQVFVGTAVPGWARGHDVSALSATAATPLAHPAKGVSAVLAGSAQHAALPAVDPALARVATRRRDPLTTGVPLAAVAGALLLPGLWAVTRRRRRLG